MTGDRFVPLPADALFAFLEFRGFVKCENGQRSRREVVYERPHDRDPSYKVLVYTSVSLGRATARARGADAIRVCAIREPAGQRGVGICKLPKVLRTALAGLGADARVQHLLDRVLARAREAYAACNRQVGARGRP